MFNFSFDRVVRVRETRISTLLAHVLMALSVFMMPIPLQFIPRAVLNGLFLIMAITALDHIQFFERIMLIFTEQVRYKKLFSVMLPTSRCYLRSYLVKNTAGAYKDLSMKYKSNLEEQATSNAELNTSISRVKHK